MLYLSGAKSSSIKSDLLKGTIGLLQTPGTRYALDGVAVWAMDNGCFTGKYPGDVQFLTFLNKHAAHKSRCLFVAAPDVVGDGAATLARFQPMATAIRSGGWPVALVAQDGMTADQIPWEQLDYLFIGGSTTWKLGMEAAGLIWEAKSRGIGVHVGRVNSSVRYSYFSALGADSADGTFIAFAPHANAPKVRAWMSQPIQGLLLNGATA